MDNAESALGLRHNQDSILIVTEQTLEAGVCLWSGFITGLRLFKTDQESIMTVGQWRGSARRTFTALYQQVSQRWLWVIYWLWGGVRQEGAEL